MKKIDVSIIIPCYNEEENIKKGVLSEVSAFLNKQKFSWEVIIASDEPTDGSLKLVKEFAKNHKGFNVLELKHGGKPSAVWGGIKKAKGEISLFTDMDQSTPLEELNKLLPWFGKDYDVVIGSRGLEREGFPLFRKLSSMAFRVLRQIFLLPSIADTQCGFKAMRTDLAKEVFSHLSFFQDKTEKKGWIVSAYDVELLYISEKWGAKIKEVPVEWKDEDISTTKRESGGQFIKESVNMVKQIFLILQYNSNGKYEKPTGLITKKKAVVDLPSDLEEETEKETEVKE